MHSFARWRVLPAKLITLIGDEIMDRSSRLDLHKSSVLLWSLAMLSYSEECTNAVMQAVVKRIDYLLQVRDYKEGTEDTCTHNYGYLSTAVRAEDFSDLQEQICSNLNM